ncbi:MAG: hypothetical protein JWM10_2634, partial [Myxococcaceae bacterium]|nr:hypothetical protein [Myxococcaceae bacterium]
MRGSSYRHRAFGLFAVVFLPACAALVSSNDAGPLDGARPAPEASVLPPDATADPSDAVTFPDAGPPRDAPAAPTPITQLALGAAHACVALADGTA